MLRILELLWHGCWHNWAVVSKGPLVSKYSSHPVGQYYTYFCNKCQRRKDINVF